MPRTDRVVLEYLLAATGGPKYELPGRRTAKDIFYSRAWAATGESQQVCDRTLLHLVRCGYINLEEQYYSLSDEGRAALTAATA